MSIDKMQRWMVFEISDMAADRSDSPGRSPFVVRPSVPADAPAILDLLRGAGLAPDDHPDHLYWKYWQPRADWVGSRSYVLTSGDEILAHAGIVPGVCHRNEVRRRVIHLIDWAARSTEAGAGALLMKRLGKLADYLIAIGGSRDTLSMLPVLGYQHCGVVSGYVRVLSPLHILRNARAREDGWKAGARFARSVVWSALASEPSSGTWRVRRVTADELQDGSHTIIPQTTSNLLLFERSETFLRYFIGCPIVPIELYVMEREHLAQGYFILSFVPGQARLADCWINSTSHSDWLALVQLAVNAASQRDGLAELAAWSTDPMLAAALEGCGFHRRLTLPIYLRGGRNDQGLQAPPRVQMAENDASYLYFGLSDLWA